MKTQSIINKLAKYGIDFEVNGSVRDTIVNGYVLTIRDQNGWASNVHIRRVNDEHDMMTDYHAGWFCHTIKAVVSGLGLPDSPEGRTAIKPAKVGAAEPVEVGLTVIEAEPVEVSEPVAEPVEAAEQPEPSEVYQDVLEQRRKLFEEKKANREYRYEELAAKNDKASTAAFEQSRKMADVIPFGQPILVGHHSEQRDRRYRDSIWNKMGQGVKLAEKADHYRDKLDAMNSNGAISSDDPDALAKLREKLADMEANQAEMKRVNAAIRKLRNADMSVEEKAQSIADSTGTSAAIVAKVLVPSCFGTIGYEGFELSNNNANMKRVKARIKALEAQHQAIERSGKEEIVNEYPEINLKIVRSFVANRIQLFFDGKPAADIRSRLKYHGFRWAPSQGAWQRQLNGNGYRATASLLSELRA